MSFYSCRLHFFTTAPIQCRTDMGGSSYHDPTPQSKLHSTGSPCTDCMRIASLVLVHLWPTRDASDCHQNSQSPFPPPFQLSHSSLHMSLHQAIYLQYQTRNDSCEHSNTTYKNVNDLANSYPHDHYVTHNDRSKCSTHYHNDLYACAFQTHKHIH